MEQVRSTTVVAVKRDGKIAMAADGQVTMGNIVAKGNARKVRKINDKIMVGFAGSAADAFTLLERFESKLQLRGNDLFRAVVELAKDWRMDKYLRKLEALMIVADKEKMYLLSGNGDVIEPDDNIITIGSGGAYALAAGKALLKNTDLSSREIAMESLNIAADICIYTNHCINVEEL